MHVQGAFVTKKIRFVPQQSKTVPRGLIVMSPDPVSRAIAARLGTLVTQRKRSIANQGAKIVRTGLPVLDETRDMPVRLGSLIDVTGVSLSGKTQVLHLVAAQALLNRTCENGPVVCWYDLNRGLDPNRLRQMIKLKQRQGKGDVRDRDNADLDGLLVYRPSSTLSLCASIHSMKKFLLAEGAGGTRKRIQSVIKNN